MSRSRKHGRWQALGISTSPIELQVMRRYLFLSVAEAAELIGHVSPRAWQYWERGERSIPEAVAQEMRRLVGWRAEAVRQAELSITEMSRAGAAAPVKLVWYPTLDDWLRWQKMPPELWRPYCSATAEISARYGIAIVAPDDRSSNHVRMVSQEGGFSDETQR